MKTNKNKALLSILLSFTVIACTSEQKIQGYVEARFTYISANFQGILYRLWVERGATIRKGQPLVTLDPQPQSANLKQAQAALNEALAEQKRARVNAENSKLRYQRRQALFNRNAIDQESLDDARTACNDALETLNKATEAVREAQGRVDEAQWSSRQKTIYALQPAFVYDTYVRQSEIVPAGKQIMSLLMPSEIYLIFYVTEPQLSSIVIGDRIKHNCDAYGKLIYSKITYISPEAEYTPPVLYGEEYRSKLLYRVEAKPLSLKDMHCLHPGQPINIFLPKGQ